MHEPQTGLERSFGTLDDPVLGRIAVAFEPAGIFEITFGGAPNEEGLSERALPDALAEPLRRYLAGDAVPLSAIAVVLRGTPFQRRVWTALRRVPRGQVRTYAGLAADVGAPRAMRAIGQAMGANPVPIVVPCHRVVAKGLALGGYTGGLDKKRHLLSLEGVALDGDRVRPGQLTLI